MNLLRECAILNLAKGCYLLVKLRILFQVCFYRWLFSAESICLVLLWARGGHIL